MSYELGVMDGQELLVKLLAAVWVGLQTEVPWCSSFDLKDLLQFDSLINGTKTPRWRANSAVGSKKEKEISFLECNMFGFHVLSFPTKCFSDCMNLFCNNGVRCFDLSPSVLKIRVWFPQEVIFECVIVYFFEFQKSERGSIYHAKFLKAYLLIPTQCYD